MKKFVLIFLALLMILCLASCNNSYTGPVASSDKIVDSEIFQLIDVVKDSNGNVLTKTYFHTVDHKIYILVYNYELDYYNNKVFTGVEFRTIDSPVKNTIDSTVNQNQTGNSGDATNNYPGYLEPGTDTTIEPCIIYNKNNIVVTITAGSYNELFNVWEYTLKIENGSNANILINSTEESFGNMMLSDIFGFYDTVPAGKTKMSSLNFWNMDELGITELIGTLTMTIEVSNSDTHDTIDQTVVNIEFK